MIIYLIRHGESTSDVDNLYGGDYDDHLSERGKKQVKELSNRLVGKGIQIIFSSSFIRAQETSNILKNSLNCELEIIDNIRERNRYGFLTGFNKNKAKQEHPELVEKLKDYQFTIKGGEIYAHFKNRIQDAFNEIIGGNFSRIAIVTHGGPIRCLFRDVLNFGEFVEDLDDCAVIEIEKKHCDFKIIKMNGATLELSK